MVLVAGLIWWSREQPPEEPAEPTEAQVEQLEAVAWEFDHALLEDVDYNLLLGLIAHIRVNQHRRALGLGDLEFGMDAYRAAFGHALYLARNPDCLDKVNRDPHTCGNGTAAEAGVVFTNRGENIGWGTDLKPDRVVELWLESPDHRQNIVFPLFGCAGLAAVQVNGVRIYVHDFVRLAPGHAC